MLLQLALDGFNLQVQTKNSSHDPVKAMLQGLRELSEEMGQIKEAFEVNSQHWKQLK